MKNSFKILVLLIGSALFQACEKDPPEIPNQEEVITTLVYTLTPDSGGDHIILSFTDLDGDGGNDPVIQSGKLAPNETYTGDIKLLNEQSTPADDITLEVVDEAEAHQFFYQVSTPGVTVNYNDMDANGQPLGRLTTLITTAIGSGQITIILRHEPNKSAADVSDGDITNAGGESDIEVTIPFDVQ